MEAKKKNELFKKHPLWYKSIYHLVDPIVRIILAKYHFKTDKSPKLTGNYIIMANHLTEVDMIMLIRAFQRKHMYFVAGEHLLRSKVGGLLKAFFDPIPEFKGTVPIETVRNILKTVREGHNVMIFPEGSRSFDGVTAPIGLSTGKLVKRARSGLITYRIKGGYFVAPRWAYHFRTGNMTGEIVHIYSPEEIAQMTDQEVTDHINEDIFEDAYETQKERMDAFTGEGLAEGLENFLIRCPKCLAYDSMQSKGDQFWCKACGSEGYIDEYGFLHGEDLPHDNVRDMGRWVMESFDEDMKERDDDALLFEDTDVKLYTVGTDHTQKDLEKGSVKIYKDRMEMGDYVFKYADIPALSGLYYGKTVLFTHEKTFYGITGEHFHARKIYRLYDLAREKKE